ncbi:MAG: glycosyltransferase [Planctomycetes bacterium]|nr:glycosyltransferase [Planctomycetota bacterium]
MSGIEQDATARQFASTGGQATSGTWRSAGRRHVLFLVSDFAPLPSVGRLRTQRFCRYLPDWGWRVSVVTLRPPPATPTDTELLNEIPSETRVYRVACPQPFEWPVRMASLAVRAVFGRTAVAQAHAVSTPNDRMHVSDATPSPAVRAGVVVPAVARAVDGIKRWLTRHFLIPDEGVTALPGMVRRAVRVIRRDRVDVIVASVPGFAPWLAAVIAGRITRRPVIVDYRDLWHGDVLRTWLGRFRRRLELAMERWALKGSSAIVTVSEQKTAYVRSLGRDVGHRPFQTIYNGFDATELPSDSTPHREPDDADRFVWLYAGRLYGHRRIDPLVEAIGRLVRAGRVPQTLLRLRILGSVEAGHAEHLRHLAQRYGLSDLLSLDGYVTRRDSLQRLLGADVTVVVVDPGPNCAGVLPGKITECMGMGCYVFGLCHAGEASDLLDEYGHAAHAPPTDPEHLERAVERVVHQFLDDRNAFRRRPARRVVPSAVEAAGSLSRLLDDVVSAVAASRPPSIQPANPDRERDAGLGIAARSGTGGQAASGTRSGTVAVAARSAMNPGTSGMAG